MLSADWRPAWFEALGILNLEGLTLSRGELDLGEWGEGFVDRRHPHTYLHELMAGVQLDPRTDRGLAVRRTRLRSIRQ